MRRRVVLEVGVTTVDEAKIAVANGADRLELCSALEVGGITPSLGMFLAVRNAVDVPVLPILRPRSGGFDYTPDEFNVISRDASLLCEHGADGLVFGLLNHIGQVHVDLCKSLIEISGGRAVFHRAFDFVFDPIATLDILIAIGFARVQTSGGELLAESGMKRIAAYREHAGGRIGILPAGRIRPQNVAQLIDGTGVDQVHAALRSEFPDSTLEHNSQLAGAMGASQYGTVRTITDGKLVREMRSILDHCSCEQ